MRSILHAVSREARALFGDAALARVRELAAPLPAFSVSGFECRLAEPQGDVDFSVYVPRMPVAWPAALLRDASWARVARIADTASPAAWVDCVQGAWLEMDARGPRFPRPSLFFHVEGARPSAEQLVALARRLGVRVPPATETFARALRALSAPGDVHLQIGAMLGRDDPRVRLVLHGVSRRDALALVAELGWRGDAAALGATMASMEPLVDRLSLGVELGDRVGDRVAVEGQIFAHRTPRWRDVARWLARERLADAAWADALLAWPGIGRCDPAPEASVGRLGPHVVRRISHVKVSVDAHAAREAKMYLLLEHRMLEALSLTA